MQEIKDAIKLIKAHKQAKHDCLGAAALVLLFYIFTVAVFAI